MTPLELARLLKSMKRVEREWQNADEMLIRALCVHDAVDRWAKHPDMPEARWIKEDAEKIYAQIVRE